MKCIFRSGILATALLFATPALADGDVDQADRPQSYEAALDQAKARLDVISWQVLENNQKLWVEKRRHLEEQLSALLADKSITPAKADKIRGEWSHQRIGFISDIQAKAPLRIRGGWSNGFTEVLIDLAEKTSDTPVRARLVSMGRDKDGKRVFCKIDGSVIQNADDLILTPETGVTGPLILRRLGVALSIESQGDVFTLCSAEAKPTGEFFNIEGAEVLFPILLY